MVSDATGSCNVGPSVDGVAAWVLLGVEESRVLAVGDDAGEAIQPRVSYYPHNISEIRYKGLSFRSHPP
jgi:hypothetical protein